MNGKMAQCSGEVCEVTQESIATVVRVILDEMKDSVCRHMVGLRSELERRDDDTMIPLPSNETSHGTLKEDSLSTTEMSTKRREAGDGLQSKQQVCAVRLRDFCATNIAALVRPTSNLAETSKSVEDDSKRPLKEGTEEALVCGPPDKKHKPDTSSSAYRRPSYPPLLEDHIYSIKTYLKNPSIVDECYFKARLRAINFPSFRATSLRKQLFRWSKILVRRKVNGRSSLCLRSNGKMILPVERYDDTFESAHLSVGEFVDADQQLRHNCFYSTLKKLESKYGIGNREFGPERILIYEHVANCTGCDADAKKLPSALSLMSRTSVLQCNNSEMDDLPDPCSEQHENIDMSGYPISMLLDSGSNSIWYHDKVSPDTYVNLLHFVDEIGLELGGAVQGHTPAINMCQEKIQRAICLVKWFQDNRVRDLPNINEEVSLKEFKEMQKSYVEVGRMDYYLYDLNILARIQQTRRFVSEHVLQFKSKTSKPRCNFDEAITIPGHLLPHISNDWSIG